ncbi:hypothetical protein [Pseudomonas aeruginosa]|uniref:hypothetical protein n=1 Tax=Pseudomonas aeruginosa TaxID=287 RepID=UPI0021E8D0BA|nr:hypothetical protein [Pseudomonas aeruginosa]MCV3851711.1 hypothetical protein [Pseudomonas aeruginosa]MCV3857742.1 hypothetical protein [Pseudomonas aeruginosa]
MREEFEAWHHAEFGYCVPEEEDPLAIGECVKRWRIWQASRAALRVELPKSDYADQLDGDAYVMESRAVAKALQQAGIEVKQ